MSLRWRRPRPARQHQAGGALTVQPSMAAHADGKDCLSANQLGQRVVGRELSARMTMPMAFAQGSSTKSLSGVEHAHAVAVVQRELAGPGPPWCAPAVRGVVAGDVGDDGRDFADGANGRGACW